MCNTPWIGELSYVIHAFLSCPDLLRSALSPNLLSLSTYRILEPAAAEAVVADTVAAVEDHGGVIDFDLATDVVLARRA